MEVVSPQQLETLRYSELQRLAKGAGLKANLKVRGRWGQERAFLSEVVCWPEERPARSRLLLNCKCKLKRSNFLHWFLRLEQ